MYMITNTQSLLQQIKKRRMALALKQGDMIMRVGMLRQQYQRLESSGNPRLNTLELIAKGLNSELMLIPKEKLSAVKAALESDDTGYTHRKPSYNENVAESNLGDDPWQDLLEDEN